MYVCILVSRLMHAQMLSVFLDHVCQSIHIWMQRGSFGVCVCMWYICGHGCGHALWKRVDVDIIYNTGGEEPEELKCGFV